MIYFDNCATTPLDPRVFEVMSPYYSVQFGNSSSTQHRMGRQAAKAVERASLQIASLLDLDASGLVFTSGATESCNLAIQGVFENYQSKGRHLICCKTEHRAVLDCHAHLRRRGAEVTYLEVDKSGRIDPAALEGAIRDDTVLVSLMWANNETGLIHPVQAIGEICKRRNVLFFCDATQAVGKVPVSPGDNGIDLLAFSAHKLYGPKGIGAIYTSPGPPRVRIKPQLYGGGQQRGVRPGTLNVPGIVAFGEAARIAEVTMKAESSRLSAMRDRLEQAFLSEDEIYVNSDDSERLPHVSSIVFKHIDSSTLMAALADKLAIASGSACSANDPDPSHVLLAMGHSRDTAKSTLRFSTGRFNHSDEVERVVDLVLAEVRRLRAESPAWQLLQKGLI